MKDLIRMNQLAGVITEGQAKKMMEVLDENPLNEELNSPSKMLELVQMYVDNYFDEGMTASAALEKIDNILNDKLDDYDKAFLKGEEDEY
jgi:hypothetical protein